jgi:hypothetical protein
MIFESRFISNVTERIAQQISDLHTELGNGSAVLSNDAAATGMKCIRIIGKIEGLKSALIHIKQIEEEMSGKGEKRKRDE